MLRVTIDFREVSAQVTDREWNYVLWHDVLPDGSAMLFRYWRGYCERFDPAPNTWIDVPGVGLFDEMHAGNPFLDEITAQRAAQITGTGL